MPETNILPRQHTAYEIVPFDRQHLPVAQDLAKLHRQLLPNSPISLLGPLFARSFYYKLLPPQGLIFGAVAYVDQQPVGFIVGTDDAENFMRVALRRHWPYLVWIVGISVLQNPIPRLGAVWEALQIMHHLPTLTISDREAELLSFGVLEEYRFSRFGLQSGHHVSLDLFHNIIQQITAKTMSSIRVIVDVDNVPARSFYKKTGWQLRRSNIPGWRIPCVELVWHADALTTTPSDRTIG
jgi:ribosomal protein S18 acetylase RimI-like enzyme